MEGVEVNKRACFSDSMEIRFANMLVSRELAEVSPFAILIFLIFVLFLPRWISSQSSVAGLHLSFTLHGLDPRSDGQALPIPPFWRPAPQNRRTRSCGAFFAIHNDMTVFWQFTFGYAKAVAVICDGILFRLLWSWCSTLNCEGRKANFESSSTLESSWI